jgi:hypothetical protein
VVVLVAAVLRVLAAVAVRVVYYKRLVWLLRLVLR